MRYPRLYSDVDGLSHFDAVEVDLAPADYAPPAPLISISRPEKAVQALFYRLPAGWFGDWHPSPIRQFYVQLGGVIEFGAGDGELRRLEPGMVVLLDDVRPPGHISRVIGSVDSVGFLVQLETASATELQ